MPKSPEGGYQPKPWETAQAEGSMDNKQKRQSELREDQLDTEEKRLSHALSELVDSKIVKIYYNLEVANSSDYPALHEALMKHPDVILYEALKKAHQENLDRKNS